MTATAQPAATDAPAVAAIPTQPSGPAPSAGYQAQTRVTTAWDATIAAARALATAEAQPAPAGWAAFVSHRIRVDVLRREYAAAREVAVRATLDAIPTAVRADAEAAP